MLLFTVRIFYILVVLAFSIPVARGISSHGSVWATTFTILVPVTLAVALLMADMLWRSKRLQALSGLFFGILAGLAIAYVLGQTVDLVSTVYLEPTAGQAQQSGDFPPAASRAPTSRVAVEPVQPPGAGESAQAAIIGLIKAFLGASAVYMCISFILQTKDDFRFVIPYVEFSKQTKGARPILLDTSVIIDGRIADIAETRILESEIVVPRFVLAELQTIADSDDKLKRNRGRRGLDILNKLQGNGKISINILDSQVPAVDQAADVDAKLVALAKHLDGRVVTNDYNLNKIAQLRGVDVININDLANALKPIVLPGEGMSVRIIKPGEEVGQGVGYLEDGTMVVAEGGREHIGKEIAITVTSVLQTSAGRMIFGRLDANGPSRRR